LNEKILADLTGKVFHYEKAVGIDNMLQGNYDKIDKVIAENCPERALQLFQTGKIIIALAFPANQPSEKQIDMLELGMKKRSIPHLKEINKLDAALKSGRNELIVKTGTETLFALANTLQGNR